MPEWSIPVDLRNPGQVFACRGLVEAAEAIVKAGIDSRFEYEGLATNATFHLRCDEDVDPVGSVVAFLRDARAITLIPRDANAITLIPSSSTLSTVKWNVDSVICNTPFVSPSRVPSSPATLPVLLQTASTTLQLDYWADGIQQRGRDNVKFWAGSGGYPGSALARDALRLLAALPEDKIAAAVRDPFNVAVPMSSSFRFDLRRDYVPLDVGFSPNDHVDVTMVGFPLTELLAAIGLQNARPARVARRDKLRYRYGVSIEYLPSALARVVLGGVDIGFPMRTFQMQLAWPGQENQARCIIDAREELT